jgi:hypothetical protein
MVDESGVPDQKAERNAAHFDLYVLLSLEGDAAGAEEHLKRAGE